VKLKQELRLRASGGEPLPTSEHCSFPPPPKARILLCRGPVLWVLELPQDRLGFVVKTYLVFVLMWILRSVRGCVVIVELGFAGSCLVFFFWRRISNTVWSVWTSLPYRTLQYFLCFNRVCRIDRLVGFGLCRVMGASCPRTGLALSASISGIKPVISLVRLMR
jgi:hypothetical protein